MQVAALLSDLISLSVCPPEAALALTSVHKTAKTNGLMSTAKSISETPSQAVSTESMDNDPDLRRATKLVSLHYDVKVKHLQSGHDQELLNARRDVEKVVSILNKGQ